MENFPGFQKYDAKHLAIVFMLIMLDLYVHSVISSNTIL